MNGQIVQQRSSYQRGLVLGLTMAEIMILLVFCLLIAMATFLKREETRRVAAEKQLQQQILQNERTRDVVATLQKSADLAEKFQSLSGLRDPQAIDQYWRELVDSKTVVNEVEKSGVSVTELREGIANAVALHANGIDVGKAIHDSEFVAAINRAMTKPGEPPAPMQAVLDTIARGLAPAVSSGHQWPPIIRMSEADGYFFKSGSAELSATFHDALVNETPGEILKYIRKYDVDVIEVVGHTDERPIGIAPVLQPRQRFAVGPEEHGRCRQSCPGGQCGTWARPGCRGGERVAPESFAGRLQTDSTVRRPACECR